MSHTSRVVEDASGRYVEIMTPGGSPGYEHGRRLYLGYSSSARNEMFASAYDDYIARLVLSRSSNGRPGNVGVSVRAEDSALAEALASGSLHPSLVEEPAA